MGTISICVQLLKYSPLVWYMYPLSFSLDNALKPLTGTISIYLCNYLNIVPRLVYLSTINFSYFPKPLTGTILLNICNY